ncbi:hypothetical protein RvY_05014 [Ramazzottius varieornatus]|uniref:Uncharacterized protein n=1 Tax=Ramazzottius varieornatus TaxID=947166 RepID=A0A1D1UTK9_RAMVA|nr:hypothetical protein RvY_05014 [Ramazzottius varieornatus]
MAAQTKVSTAGRVRKRLTLKEKEILKLYPEKKSRV